MALAAKKLRSWLIWLLITLSIGTYLGCALVGDNKSAFLPGATTDGHHQIELACESCHGDEGFGGKDALQKACVRCHGQEFKAVEDSHPKGKFTDPRNAERVAQLDATYCVTCHAEHRPEHTRIMGVTLPDDFCRYCHDDIAKERPSHQDMAFDTCASAGCHNFHDNEALYEDYLVKHAGSADTGAMPLTRARDLKAFLAQLNGRPAAPLDDAGHDAPTADVDKTLLADWSSSAHARGGVNCSGCHAPEGAVWQDKPPPENCKRCHGDEQQGFAAGKHGMRVALSLPPMAVADARLPMKAKARDKSLGCQSCHSSHAYDTRRAAVEACLGCHDDEHSRAYKQSAHFSLWQKELSGEGPVDSGVSCATCHLPRLHHKQEGIDRTLVQHNQNFNLEPNEKMIRSVCLSCHGLSFSIDALADAQLLRNNFQGKPPRHIKSIEMAVKREAEVPPEKRKKRRSSES